MSNMGTAGATDGLARAADDLFEIRSGVTFPAAYALMTRAYFDEFGGDREDLAHIAVKNHDNALVNDHAHLQEEITVDDVLESPEIAAPLGLYDACPISDGAAALVLLSPSYAEEHGLDTGVAITGSGHGGDTMALQDRQSLATAPPRATPPKRLTTTPASVPTTSASSRSTTALRSRRCSPSRDWASTATGKLLGRPDAARRAVTARCQ